MENKTIQRAITLLGRKLANRVCKTIDEASDAVFDLPERYWALCERVIDHYYAEGIERPRDYVMKMVLEAQAAFKPSGRVFYGLAEYLLDGEMRRVKMAFATKEDVFQKVIEAKNEHKGNFHYGLIMSDRQVKYYQASMVIKASHRKGQVTSYVWPENALQAAAVIVDCSNA